MLGVGVTSMANGHLCSPTARSHAVQNYDDGDKGTGRAYGHALVVGLSKEPRKVQAAP